MSFLVTTISQSFVKPSSETPSQCLKLSPIDRVPGLRHAVRSLHVFQRGQNPGKVIREALSKVLVLYYPFAGRFVEKDGGEVVVDCSGEGAWFVEATASCSLEDVRFLDHPLMVPLEDLMPDTCLEAGVHPLDIPLMIQVTEFKCGGFVVGIFYIHTIADGLGVAQFFNAIAEHARGYAEPSTNPITSRDIVPSLPNLLPRGPPPNFLSLDLQHISFDLPLNRIYQVKASYFKATNHHCSAIDITIAKAWQSRTRAINLDPESPVHVCFFASIRHLLTPQVLPPEGGYYGNCFFPVTATAQSAKVANGMLEDVVRIIRDAKVRLPTEFTRWIKGEFKRNPYEVDFAYNSLFVSDWTRIGFLEVDYGWGKPVHVKPFAYYDFMAVAIIGAPVAPKKGVRVMTQCVKKEHLLAFQEHMRLDVGGFLSSI